MKIFNLFILSFIITVFPGCYRADSYGLDPLLEKDEVAAYITAKEGELLQEYNESKRYDTEVVEVDLEFRQRSRNDGSGEVILEFIQQVRDEFGKRIALFEKRGLRVTFIQKNGHFVVSKEEYIQ